jgi:hypothetical protein
MIKEYKEHFKKIKLTIMNTSSQQSPKSEVHAKSNNLFNI